MISPGFFSFLQNLIFGVFSRLKGQKNDPINEKSVCCIPYLRNHTSYDCHLCYTSVKWRYLQSFFYFFKVLIFQVVSGVKGQKVAQNDKKFCLSWLTSHHIVVHNCKMIISSGIFFVFSKCWSFGLLGWSKGKKCPKWQNSFIAYISGTIYHMIFIYICYRIAFIYVKG